MRKALIVLGAVTLVGFALIALLHRRAAVAESDAAGEILSPEKQRIREFWTLYNEANADRIAGDFERAIPGFRKCLALNPKHEDSLYNLGTSLAELGEYTEAAAVFRRLIEVNPQSNRAWSELGNTLSAAAPGSPGDFEGARKAFLWSIEINREQAGPFLQLGRLELNQDDTRGALKYLRTAAGFGSPEGNFLMGYALYLAGSFAEAAKSFQKVLEQEAHERRIAGRGIVSEGDVAPAPGKPMTAMEKAAVKSLLFLYWTSVKLGGYPAGTPKPFRLQPRKSQTAHVPNIAVRISEDSRRESGDRCRTEMQRAGIAVSGIPVACIAEDFDRDGKPDWFVLSWKRGAALYLNQGQGRFIDVTAKAGLAHVGETSFSAAVFDYDRDGLPDILVTAQAPFEEAARCFVQPLYRAPRYTPRLFRNKGGGHFEEVTASVGLTRCYSTMQAVAADLDSDGWTDLLLVNGSLDRLRLEPSVALHNLSGKAFEEWFHLPSFSQPGNFLRATVRPSAGGRSPEIDFTPNSQKRGLR